MHAIAGDLLPRRAVIADGHHRYATYLRHQADRHAAGDGAGPWDRGLALLVDASAYGPQVHAIHRYVPGLGLDDAVARAAAGFAVRDVDAAAAPGRAGRGRRSGVPGHRRRPLGAADRAGEGAGRGALPAERSAAWRGLDVTVAHRLLIDRLWGLQDTEGRGRLRARRPGRGGGGPAHRRHRPAAEPDPRRGRWRRSRRPASGCRAKSTLFTPKPRTGLLIRAYADEPDR
jgi:hypothetical protein